MGLGLTPPPVPPTPPVGDARLNGAPPSEACGLAGVCGFDPEGGVRGGWKRRPGSLSRCDCWVAGDCGPR